MLEKHPPASLQVNGGFFVVEPAVLDRIDGDASDLGARRRCRASRATASWRPTSTTATGSRWTPLWERELLEELWAGGRAPWKVW